MGNAEAMVTARMGVGKKEEGNRVLASLGTNASKAVNQLYDYVIESTVKTYKGKICTKCNYTKDFSLDSTVTYSPCPH